MINKYLKILLIASLVLFSISAVSAEDIAVEDLNIEASSSSEVAISNYAYGTYTDLQTQIDQANSSDEINLDTDYKYTNGTDDSLIGGIQINKSITINGNGFEISGNNTARIFNITANNVILNNITLMDGKNETGGVIYNTGSNVSLTNSMLGSLGNYLYNNGSLFLEKNFMATGNLTSPAIYNDGVITSSSFLTFLDNDTVFAEFNDSVILSGQLSDDNGNLIIGNQNVNITIDGNNLLADSADYYYYYNYIANKTGNFIVSGNATGYTNLTIQNGKLVVRKDANLTTNVTIGDLNVTFDFTAEYNASGNITISINGNDYNTELSNGTATITIPLAAGDYAANITYEGDDEFWGVYDGTYFNVPKLNATLSGNNTVLFYKNGTRYYVIVLDSNGNPIANTTVNILLNGVNIPRDTDENGTVSIAINLNPGIYEVIVSLISENYTADNITNNITVFSTIESEDLEMYYNNGTQFNTTILDGNGNPIANVTVTINIEGEFFNASTDENGTAKFDINLTPGTYTVTVTHPLDGLTMSNNITVLSTIDSEDIEMYYNNGTQYIATIVDGNGNPIADRNVTINFNGENITVKTDANGTIKLDIDLAPGTYTVTITNPNDNLTATNNITVLSTIDSEDIEMYYNNGTQYIATIIDGNGNPIANTNVTININGENRTVQTDANGTIKLDINFAPGEYTLTIINPNDNLTVTNNITVLSTINSENIIKYYKNGTQYIVTVFDGQGNPLANTNVTLNINGQNYTRTTDINGTIKFSINLAPGNYTLTVINPNDNLTVVNNVTVLFTTKGENIVKYYRNGTQYYVTVFDGEGNPIANTTVLMNINGVFYNRTTDINGTAMLTINLNPGNYTITTTNPNDNGTFSNQIEVLPTVLGDDIVKYYRNGTQYYVTVLDANGAPIANRTVTMNINGVFYNRTTNANGTATLTINLNPGNYTITTSNPNDNGTLSNNIEVLPILTGSDLNKTFAGNETYDTVVVDGQGNPLANVTVEINIHGVFYNRTTDSSGVAKLNINLDPGTYIATAYYNNYATSNKIVVRA